MPLEKQLSSYGNEATFISDFLVPLLRRLGFSVVAEYHGTHEFGKDLVFGEVDRFGHVVYHGLQAKYLESLSQSDSHGLVEDCHEAFNNPFRHPHTGSEERISCFFVANAGSIPPNTRTNFFNSLSVPHGGHIRMLDGKALLALDRWAMVNRVDAVRELLSGLRVELRYNSVCLKALRENLDGYIADSATGVTGLRLRSAAVSNYLTRPFMSTHIAVDSANNYWVELTVLNGGMDYLLAAGSLEMKRKAAQSLLVNIDNASRLGEGLAAATDVVLSQLGPLTGL